MSTAFKGWMRPGPLPPGGSEPGPDETLDGLCGHWKIFQAAKGHRFSVDDLLGAWYGTQWCPRADRVCDLGSGIGTLALVAAWRCPGAVVHTVEAQEMSLALAEKSVAYNGVADRFTLHHGDLRDEAIHAALLKDGAFDLVMGSPPYWPVTDRLAADHPQAIPARLEVRGSIADYAAAAAKLLAPGGLFACVFPNDQRTRARAAYRDADLVLLHEREVIFKEGEAYGIILLAGSRRADFPPDFETKAQLPEVEAPILIRRADASVHPSIALARVGLGFPPGL
ncbi:MAG TPA: methyltransferase [Holophagaceae bacterium]|nr:methyltransferase [Holophagaceae bacterium]